MFMLLRVWQGCTVRIVVGSICQELNFCCRLYAYVSLSINKQRNVKCGVGNINHVVLIDLGFTSAN